VYNGGAYRHSYSHSIYSSLQVLAAIKSDGLESQKSVERARQVLEALRNQISAHFDVPETESVSDGDQGAQAG
jgi:hypothetical protein